MTRTAFRNLPTTLFAVCALLLSACGKDEQRLALDCTQRSVLLHGRAGATSSFVVSAGGPWELSVSGEGFDAAPKRGGRGETLVTVTAAEENTLHTRRELGSLEIRLSGYDITEQVSVAQSPAVVPRTVLMYFPWSGNLTSYFRQNIADMERIVAQGLLGDERLLVFFMDTQTHAVLFELLHDDGASSRLEIKEYSTAPDFTTAEGIASILDAARQAAPADRYAMTIGSHGMSWLPVSAASARAMTADGGAEREYWEWEEEGRPLTRWFGGTEPAHRTEIGTLADGIRAAGMKMDYILFDDCYMSSVEVAYALQEVTDHLIGSTCEIMAYGFPYAEMGRYLFGETDYAAICRAFHDFYSTYRDPYGTIGVTVCAELKGLADVMRRINARYTFDERRLDDLQALDGYTPVRFFDLGDYVRRLCTDDALLSEFEERLERVVPADYRRHTPEYYSMSSGAHPIRTFSGITCSDPSISPATSAKRETAWWKATH